jgi:formamidopyrimidine-DNA glycosylase
MPELPEVETTRRDLEPLLIGRRIRSIVISDDKPQPQAPVAAEEFARAVVGHVVEALGRRGKNLYLRLSNGLLWVIHRRMTGNLIWRAAGDSSERPRFERASIDLDDGAVVVWQDQRKFGTWTLTSSLDQALPTLGPEPLAEDWAADDLRMALARRSAPIKAALLDQTTVAGLGNIYADEALFRSHVHPLTPANTLSDATIARLHEAIRFVLQKAIDLQGSSARNHLGGLGQKGTMQEEWRAYDRTGQPCYRCGAAIIKLRVAGRGTHICPTCQPAPTLPAP